MANENVTITTIADLQIVPDKFAEYVIEEATKKSALIRSGVAVGDPTVADLINGTPKGGNIINIPFYKQLDGDDEVFGEDEMTAGKVETGSDTATLLIRQRAWGDTDLAHVFGGTDPIGAIATMTGDYWAEREQVAALAILKGLFTGATAALKSHVLDVSAAEGTDALISTDNTLDAKQLMGDAADKLGVVFMHSATHTFLQKANVIETIPASESRVAVETYLGYEVIVDDDAPVSEGVYDTYFLGRGAFAREDGVPKGLVPVEKYRDALKSSNYLINRRAFVLHPKGCKWNANATLAKKYASNSELATPANWSLAKDAKNVPIVCLRHRIAVVSASNTETDPETEGNG